MSLAAIAGIYIAFINIATYISYAMDKKKAKKGTWRTPEATLLGLAAIGGSIGALIAMKILRHKTQHPQFYIGVPVILIAQIALAVFVYVQYVR